MRSRLGSLVLAALATLGACGSKSSSAPAAGTGGSSAATTPTPAAPAVAACERGRDGFLGFAGPRAAELIAGAPPDQRAALQARSDAELAAVRTKFVAACQHTPGYDETCFTNLAQAESPRCKATVDAIMGEILPR